MKKFKFALMCAAALALVACEPKNPVDEGNGEGEGEGTEYVNPIDVTDGSAADWDALPAEFVASATHNPDCSMDGLKSVKVYSDEMYLNILVEVNLETVVDHAWTSFHVYLNADNSAETGGYSDQFADPDSEVMLETAIYQSGAVAYNPAVFKWWGEVGGAGWAWTEHWEEEGYYTDGDGLYWGAIVGEGTLPIGVAQQVGSDISVVEIQLLKELIPATWADEFTVGFDIQQNWTSCGILPNAADDAETGNAVYAKKLVVKVDKGE